jgi:D-aspartate ligase
MQEEPTVPAVVVGGNLNGLGVVRSLVRGRMPIYLVDTSRRCPAAWSRHCQFVPSPALEGPELMRTLRQLATRSASRPVLFLTGDHCVDTVSAHRAEVQSLYRIGLPDARTVTSLADKALFHLLAEREHFAVPRTIAISSRAEIAQLANLVPPLVLKPADKKLEIRGVVPRAVAVDSHAQARAVAKDMLLCAPTIVVQEWIDGPDSEIFFTLFSCDRRNEIIALFVGRKLVCSPPAVGSTVLCVAAPEVAEELCATTRRFVSRIGYCGLGSLEFKRDSRTGRFLIVEPTVGRTDWQEEIATLCGINLPLLTYWAELDRPLPRCEALPRSVAWRSSAEYRTPGEFLGADVPVIDGYLRWADPVPALFHYGYERFALRVWNRLASWITPEPMEPYVAEE